jgi:hypothetical protein
MSQTVDMEIFLLEKMNVGMLENLQKFVPFEELKIFQWWS